MTSFLESTNRLFNLSRAMGHFVVWMTVFAANCQLLREWPLSRGVITLKCYGIVIAIFSQPSLSFFECYRDLKINIMRNFI